MRKIRNRFSIILLVLIAAFLQADQNLLAPNFHHIMKEFEITEKELGFISSAFIFISAFMTVIWGILSDFQSRKLLLLIGVLLGEIPCFLTAYATSFLELFFLRMLTGIGIGSIIPVAYSLVADFFYGEERGKGYAYIETAFGFGTLMGMILAGLIADWRLPFILAATPNLILAPLFYFVTVEPKRGQSEKQLEDLLQKTDIQFRFEWSALKKSLQTKTNLLIFAQGILGTVPWGIITIWFISFFIFKREISKDTATFILLLIGLSAVIGSFTGGLLGDYFEKKEVGKRTYVAGIGILVGTFSSLGIIFYPFTSEISTIEWILLSLYSLLTVQFISFAGPNVRAIVSEVNLPEDRGTVFGIFNILDNLGRSIGPLMGGILIYYFENILNLTKGDSYLYTLTIGILFWLPSSIIWLFIKKFYNEDRKKLGEILEERKLNLLNRKLENL